MLSLRRKSRIGIMWFLTNVVRGVSLFQVGDWCATLVCVAIGVTAGCSSDPPPAPAEVSAPSIPPADGLPKTVTNGGYASSSACQSCHPRQHASWHKTFHRRMTQVANADAVLAPFNGEEISFGDWRLRMMRRDGQFWVEQRPGSLCNAWRSADANAPHCHDDGFSSYAGLLGMPRQKQSARSAPVDVAAGR